MLVRESALPPYPVLTPRVVSKTNDIHCSRVFGRLKSSILKCGEIERSHTIHIEALGEVTTQERNTLVHTPDSIIAEIKVRCASIFGYGNDRCNIEMLSTELYLLAITELP